MIKKITHIIALLLFCLMSLNSLSAVQAIFNYKQFMAPAKGIYIENYLSFVSSSLKYKTKDGKPLQARLLVTQILKRNDSIIDFKKYNVLGPVLKDSVAVDFKDQKRFAVTPGNYEVELEVLDLNDEKGVSVTSSRKITVKPYNQLVNISDIELIDYFKKTGVKKNEFSKSGYDIYPMVSNYLSSEIEKLAFYFELYTKKTNNKVLVKQYIETYYGNILLPNYLKRSVKELKEVTPILNVFNISKLPSGNYNLVIEIRDSLNKIIAKDKIFVQRVNYESFEKPVATETVEKDQGLSYQVSEDSMDYFLESMVPISNTLEFKVLRGDKSKLTLAQKQNYFANFWQSRYGINAVNEWNKYRALVYEVESLFGNKIKRGFETDMGRVYIKYGKPNDMQEKLNEQGTYPYVIWHYYQTQNRSNVMFVFYHTTAVSQDFELIHSTMPGEIKNNNWKNLINMRVGGNDSRVDQDERRMR